jgi:AcrR family transcriptional regulator
VYDVRRHTASRIAAVLGAHHAAFVGGRLQRTDDASRGTRPRDRILSAASLLFPQAGVRAVGVDALIKEARVAKATFYRHFPSKDSLIVAWLEDPRTRWLETVRARTESRATSADDVIPQFFSAVAEWLEAGDFRGCPYLNTSMELTDPAHPATTAIRSYLDEVQAYLAQALTAAGYRDVATLAPALQSLVAGSITLGVAHRSVSFVHAAREAAIRLLENAPRT